MTGAGPRDTAATPQLARAMLLRVAEALLPAVLRPSWIEWHGYPTLGDFLRRGRGTREP